MTFNEIKSLVDKKVQARNAKLAIIHQKKVDAVNALKDTISYLKEMLLGVKYILSNGTITNTVNAGNISVIGNYIRVTQYGHGNVEVQDITEDFANPQYVVSYAAFDSQGDIAYKVYLEDEDSIKYLSEDDIDIIYALINDMPKYKQEFEDNLKKVIDTMM